MWKSITSKKIKPASVAHMIERRKATKQMAKVIFHLAVCWDMQVSLTTALMASVKAKAESMPTATETGQKTTDGPNAHHQEACPVQQAMCQRPRQSHHREIFRGTPDTWERCPKAAKTTKPERKENMELAPAMTKAFGGTGSFLGQWEPKAVMTPKVLSIGAAIGASGQNKDCHMSRKAEMRSRHTKREEDLGHSCGPHVSTFGEDAHVPFTNVSFNPNLLDFQSDCPDWENEWKHHRNALSRKSPTRSDHVNACAPRLLHHNLIL